MATYGWRKTVPVKRALFDEGHRFGFFQAVRLLEAIYPDRTGPAEGMEPEREVVRFRSRVGFDFPASEVDEVRPGRDGEPVEMTVSVLGLAGIQGPLPPPFVEELLHRSSRGDDALRDFLDLFNHRLLSLYYRARKKHRPACSHEPPDEGRVARCLLALIGLGTPALRDRGAVPDRSLIRYAGLLTPHPRSMVGLERMLADHFGVPAEIVPFRGRWLDIEEEDRTRIGGARPTRLAPRPTRLAPRETPPLPTRLAPRGTPPRETAPTRLAPRAGGGGNNNRLGQGAVLGSRFWDQTAAFEIRLGPLGIQELLDFLPVGGAHRALLDLARFYVDDQYEIDVRLSCRADEVPELRLGGAGDVRLGWSARLTGKPGGDAVPSVPRLGQSGGARLGWTTWLGSGRSDSEQDAGRARGGVGWAIGTAPSVLLREVS